MDIFATDGSFSVAMAGIDSFLYVWDKKDKSLLVKANPKTEYPHDVVMIQTNAGDFIEAVDHSGKIVFLGGDGEWCHVNIGKKWTRLRFRKLSEPKLSKEEFDKARKIVTRTLYSDSPYSLGLNSNLADAIKILQAKLAEVPMKYRKTAQIEFRDRISYGESYENVAITYAEPETDEELKRRLTVEAERGRITLAKKKAKLESLKAELCDQP